MNTQTPRQALGQVADEVMSYLKFLSDMGCSGLECSEKSLETIASWGIVKGRAAALKAGAARRNGPVQGASGATGNVAGVPPMAGGGQNVSSASQAGDGPLPAPAAGPRVLDVAPSSAVPSSPGSQEQAVGQATSGSGRVAMPPGSDPGNMAEEMRRAAAESWSKYGTGSSEPPDTLERIRTELDRCSRCGISRTKKNLVFGAGNPRARLMFIGEAPGEEDDQAGMPFAGEPGRLLNRMIEAMSLSREDVYLCNIVKCRPEGGRTPSPEEISNCYPYLERQIRAVNPDVICALGAYATMVILGVRGGVAQMRGQFQAYGRIKVMPTFHPVFLMNNPACKKAAWEDLQKVMGALGIRR